ncbi:MAG TPA: flagellar hook-basal body complex protein FliE [Pyrinomonadaceae bacterium]|nr:flagellar hook-basal body complex protein FliE [Pyrinomonadaceae bacterium]
MTINGLNPSTLISQIGSSNTNAASGVKSDGSFGSMVKDAVQSVEKSQGTSDRETALAVTGESPDLHRTIIALQTADLTFQFALQVRNKVVGAYEEIMRMQV